MIPTVPEADVCHSCYTSSSSLKPCTRCKLAKYCDMSCQEKDWPKHKLVCMPVKVDDATTRETCSFCNTIPSPLKACTRCKKAKYCGVSCQKKDWPKHKLVCVSLKDDGSTTTIDICSGCNKKSLSLKFCTRCKKAKYCGVSCQRKDWEKHKVVCKAAVQL